MQETKAFIAAIETDIAHTEQALAELERMATEHADVAIPATDEMRELFERLEAIPLVADPVPSPAVPHFAIRI